MMKNDSVPIPGVHLKITPRKQLSQQNGQVMALKPRTALILLIQRINKIEDSLSTTRSKKLTRRRKMTGRMRNSAKLSNASIARGIIPISLEEKMLMTLI